LIRSGWCNIWALGANNFHVADECFLTGTAVEVIAVVKVDNRTIGSGTPGPVTRDLKERFHRLARS
jgi:branched-chain amino acid aminotransferase